MPTYQYVCTGECGQLLEAVQSFSDAALEECPTCGGRLRKKFSAVGVVFKGSGFYRTDSRPGGNAASGSGGKDGAKEGSAAGGSGSSGSADTGSSSTASSSTGTSGTGGSGSGGSGSSASGGSGGSSTAPAKSA